MKLNWLPWRYIVRRVARAHGFLDPMALLSQVERFAQPSEVREPIELLRAGVVFHARGLINSRVIQHNLDWVWPLWIERQFDPADVAFIPRAFSLTHVNLTHRNWTAAGLPGSSSYPIVGPEGMLTPHYDDWSIDAWIIADDGRRLFPSREKEIKQRYEMSHSLVVETEVAHSGLRLHSSIDVAAGEPLQCRMRLRAEADAPAWLAIVIRPFNPEGVSLVNDIELDADKRTWRVDGTVFNIGEPAERFAFSTYRDGDVLGQLPACSGSANANPRHSVNCNVGMATAAALYRLEPSKERELTVTIPLITATENADAKKSAVTATSGQPVVETWPAALQGMAAFRCPDEHFKYLYDAAVRTLILCSPGEVFPGPYTYRRFWYRDAALILHALLVVSGEHQLGRVERALDRFPAGQSSNGYFHSQEGEWDSNGEVLWILRRYCELSGRAPHATWHHSIISGARWIERKRLAAKPDSPHAGLLPPGFSAEHFGPIDYYYWDDFWGVEGLRSAAHMMHKMASATSHAEEAARFERTADEFAAAINRSLAGAAQRLGRPGAPASPYRRLDAGAIGSVCAGYPLQHFTPDDPRLADLIEFLLKNCFVQGGFFQDMIHSGINAYLTLHVAQVLLRGSDSRAFELIQSVADLASPTGQWPEAIHPATRGGCMGDGQHVWAAAEWVLMLRNMFVREDDATKTIILASGVPARWLDAGGPLEFGPTLTPYGPIQVAIESHGNEVTVSWQAQWRGPAPRLEIRIAGSAHVIAGAGQSHLTIQRGI